MIKYSIVIPHWHNFNELLKPCLESIIKNTSKEKLNETEIIVVANGSDYAILEKFAARDYSDGEIGILPVNIKIIRYPDAIGYTRATNAGIKEAKGEFVILMNDDCVILDYAPKDEWLDILEKPFEDQTVGVTGVKKIYSQQAKSSFLVFFLVMIRRSIFETVGYLDESFSPGGGEDIDFCLRLKKFGLKAVKAPNDDENYEYGTQYPVYHAGEKSVHDVEGWEEGFWKRMAVIEHRVNSFQYEEFADVTAYVSTKGRYTTTLPACLAAIANQTLKPSHLIIFQDDHKEYNMQESSVFRNLLYGLFAQKGIQWSVVFGEGKGQVLNHQKALDIAKTGWLWRVDDDNIPEPNVLEGLCKHINPNVGAIASAVIDPVYTPSDNLIMSPNEMKYIHISPNFQWTKSNKVVKAEHLYSSFLIRKEAGKHGYNKDLSIVAHREETIFTFEMYRNGWDLIIDTNLVTWHLRESTGGIRSFSDGNLWAKDDAIFNKKILEWGIKMVNVVPVNLDCGMGDHWMFKKILIELLQDSSNMVVVAACYPAVFEDLIDKYGNLMLISIADGNNIFGKEKMDNLNIYKFCDYYKWDKHVVLAMEKLYLNK